MEQTLSFPLHQLSTENRRLASSLYKRMKCNGLTKSEVPTLTTKFLRLRAVALKTNCRKMCRVSWIWVTTSRRISLWRIYVRISFLNLLQEAALKNLRESEEQTTTARAAARRTTDRSRWPNFRSLATTVRRSTAEPRLIEFLLILTYQYIFLLMRAVACLSVDSSMDSSLNNLNFQRIWQISNFP